MKAVKVTGSRVASPGHMIHLGNMNVKGDPQDKAQVAWGRENGECDYY